MVFTSRVITYGELRNGLNFEKDKYNIVSYEYETRRQTFLANPCAGKDEDSYMYIVEADGTPVGRTFLFDSRLKIENRIVPLYSGSGLEVVEEYRKYGFGGEIFAYGGTIKTHKLILSAGISDMALPLYKVSKFHLFEFPKYLRLQNSKPIFRKLGIKGVFLCWISSVVNFILNVYYSFVFLFCKGVKKRFVLEKVNDIPEWVDDIVLNDGHKYAEVHDHKWFQWNLDNNFKGHKRDIQSFYIIKQQEKNVGFVMTKERFRPDVQGMKNVVIGSIVEWGSKEEEALNEFDIYKLTIDTFSKDVDIIETATDANRTKKGLRCLGFIHYGNAHISFRDKTKQLSDSGNASLWRLRYGYADVILN